MMKIKGMKWRKHVILQREKIIMKDVVSKHRVKPCPPYYADNVHKILALRMF